MVSWKTKGWGVTLGTVWLSILLWADNIYFFARTRTMLQNMVQDVTKASEANRLYWKPELLEYITSLSPEVILKECSVQMRTVGTETKSWYPMVRKETLKVLGTTVKSDGNSWTPLQERLKIAQGLF